MLLFHGVQSLFYGMTVQATASVNTTMATKGLSTEKGGAPREEGCTGFIVL